MQRQSVKQGVMVSAVMGFMWLGGVSYVTAAEQAKKPAEQAKKPAEQAKKPAEQAAPPAAGKVPAAKKKAPENKPAAKGGVQKTKPAAATAPKGPAPKYASAETADKSQACFGEAPKIEAVQPDEGKAGDKVTILGRGFGPAECLRSLSFGPGHAATFKFESDSKIMATVPNGSRKGLAMMTVTTASGEDSKIFVVK